MSGETIHADIASIRIDLSALSRDFGALEVAMAVQLTWIEDLEAIDGD